QQSRIAVSRWESGAQPPTKGPLYEWCQGLGLFTPTRGALVTFVDITPRLLKILKGNPEHLRQLSPSQFEQFIAERLDRMGFDVTLTGATSHRDGGIDLIAVPKVRTVGAFLLAGQVKHHQGDQKTGREAVDRLLAWKDSHFRLGLLATNTEFTKDARWAAAQVANQPFLRLRDFEDLKRWLGENFYSLENWQEIPDEVNLAPGVTVAIPKPKLKNSRDIWPLSQLDLKDVNDD
ncbi:MAG TPA: restriction endonuclease, partial [Blastocatellia bacterium]